MAEDGADADGEPVPWPLYRRVAFGLFASLIGLALAFWIWWGVSFGVWIDNGVYAVVITLLGFGLAGMWLVMPESSAPATGVPRT